MDRVRQFLYSTADGLSVGVCLTIIGRIYVGHIGTAAYRLVTVMAILLWWGVSLWIGNASQHWSRTRDDAIRVGLIAAIGGILLSFLLFAFKMGTISRVTVGASVIASYICMFGIRAGARAYLRWLCRHGLNTDYVMVVGLPEMVRRFTAEVVRHPETGLFISSLVLIAFPEQQRELAATGADDTTSRRIAPVTIFSADQIGQLPALVEELLHQHVVDEVVIGLPLTLEEVIEDVILRCEREGKTVRLLPDSLATRLNRYRMVTWYGQPVLSVGEGEERDWQLRVKRALDVVLSLVLLIALSPILACIALAIKLDSEGPVLFVQERVGKNGRRFKCLKFRTMVIGAEKQLQELKHLNEMSGPVFKMRNDPRVTRVGRLLRRTSLDELPQLWNVLKGEMSLVGPRPPLPSEVDQYDSAWRKRLSVRPGLTCLWQISGRNDVDFDDWMKMDLEYVDRWSLWLDVKILFKTIPAVLHGKGAY